MNYNELRYFLEVADSANLSHAAERLGVSQPSLSLAMKRLEDTMQCALLVRHKKGVRLTPAGAALHARVRHLLLAWDNLKSSVTLSNIEMVGQLTIGCHASVALRYLPQILPNLLQAHPKLSLKIVNGLSREINEAIVDFRIDIGVVVNPLRHPSLVIRKLHDDWVGFWAHEDLIEKIDFNADSSAITIIGDTNLTQSASLLKRLKSAGVAATRFVEDENLESVAMLTGHGAGVGILPESIANRTANGCLRQVFPKIRFKDEICLVYREENRSLPTVRAFIKAAAN